MEFKKGLILILICANIILSFYLAYLEATGNQGICLTGQGCQEVRNSAYSAIYGIKLAYLGLASFSALLILYFLAYKNKIPYALFMLASLLGAILALYFLYLQAFVIRAFCSTCLATDTIAIVIAVLAIIDYHNERTVKLY